MACSEVLVADNTCKEGGCAVGRPRHLIEARVLIALVVAFLIAVVMVGCGRGPENMDGRGGERGAAATNEETTAHEGD